MRTLSEVFTQSIVGLVLTLICIYLSDARSLGAGWRSMESLRQDPQEQYDANALTTEAPLTETEPSNTTEIVSTESPPADPTKRPDVDPAELELKDKCISAGYYNPNPPATYSLTLVVLYSIVGTVVFSSVLIAICSCMFLSQNSSILQSSIRRSKRRQSRTKSSTVRSSRPSSRKRRRSYRSKSVPSVRSKQRDLEKSEQTKTLYIKNNGYKSRDTVVTTDAAFIAPKDSSSGRHLSKDFDQPAQTTVTNPATKTPVTIVRPAPPPPTLVLPEQSPRLFTVRPTPPARPARQRSPDRPKRLIVNRPAPPPPTGRPDEIDRAITPRSPNLPETLDTIPVRPPKRRKRKKVSPEYTTQMPI